MNLQLIKYTDGENMKSYNVDKMQIFDNFLNERKINVSYFDKTSITDVYVYIDMGAAAYIHYTSAKGIIAYMTFQQNMIYHKGKSYPVVQQRETFNNDCVFNDCVLTIFEEMNRYYSSPIFTEDKNSFDLMSVFNQWIFNRDKVGLKNFFIYDSKSKKIMFDTFDNLNGVWDSDLTLNKYSLVFDFFDTLKEDNYTEELNNSFKDAPGFLSRLHYSGTRKTPRETTFF